MKKTSIKHRQTGSRMIKILSAVLIPFILLAALPVCISAAAATIITYKVEVTSESKASGWNSARLELHYKDRSGNKTSDTWDIKNDISNGNNVVKIVKRYETDKVPYMIRLYLDFGGGFTIRTHSGRVKLSVEGEEITNEAYSATSYPFSSSDKTMDFGIYGLVPAEVISADGSSKSYATVKQAWNEAKNTEGSTVKLSRNSTIKGTLEVNDNMKIDLNGCLLANAETGALFDIKKGGDLSIIDSDPTRDTGETFFCTTGMTSEEEAESRTYHLKGGGIFHGGSEESGGAIKVEKGGTLSMNGCTITDCHSREDSGGAIYCEGTLNMKGTKFIFCTALEGNGGAICISGEPDISLENLTFERCSAENGGAVSFENVKTPGTVSKFDNCTFNNCQAEDYGGAYYNIGRSNISADGLTFKNCRAECGGGLYIASGGTQFNSVVYPNTVSNSKFENCSAKESGGGVGYYNAAELTLQNVEFNGCKSEDDGGAIHLITIVVNGRNDYGQHDIRINNCDIHHCTAEDEGGGICVDDERSTDINNVTILHNSSVHDNTAKTGGGIYVVSDYVYIVGSAVTNNTATGKNGGGIYVDSMDDIEVAEEVVIRDNIANGEKNNLCLQNGTFSSAKLYCGGLYDGSYIGLSSTSNSSATVAKNISMYQVNKYLHSDDYARSFSMTNTKEVSTPLFASMISENISLMIIIGGVIIIAGVIVILYFRKRRKEGRKNEAKDEHTGAETDKENE
ncbi:MAG: hypothetical protein UIH27_04105 [Ruminococcus sp.]|nr:hypothetical protein [Ruminococcus sp.]